MASVGSLDVIIRLMGGQQVLAEARQIRKDLEALNKPIDIKVNMSANAGNGVQSVQNTVAATTRSMDGLARSMNTLGGSWNKTIHSIARFSDGLTHAGQVAATFAYRMSLISAGVGLLLGASLKFTTDLESSLAKVGTQLDGSLDKIRKYTQESKSLILDLQSTYGVKAGDISSALYYQVSSGVDPRVAQAALDPISKLAAVSGSKASTVSQGLTAAMNVFREELEKIPDLAQRSTHALEILWEATKKGRFEFEDFATQFGRSAGQAEAAGLTFEQTAGMLAALSQVFTPSQSSTSLNSFMKAFIDQTKEAKEAFAELGVEIYETVNGITTRRPAMDVFLEVFEKLGKIYQTDAKKGDSIISAMFGDVRGGRAAQFFRDPQNVKNLQDIISGIVGADGGLERDWKLTSEQIGTQIDILIGKFYQLGDVAVTYLKPTINGALGGIKSLFEFIGSNPQIINILAQLGVTIAALAPAFLALGTVMMGAGGIVTAIATLMSPAYLIGFGLAWEQLAPSITAAATAVEYFGGGINGILATVTELARQLGIISQADAIKIFEQLGAPRDIRGINAVSQMLGDLQGLAPELNALKDGILGIAAGIGKLIDNISRGEGILGKFATVVKGLGGAIGGLAGLSGASLPDQVAGGLDKIIGGALLLKIGSAVVGALKYINTNIMTVTAGQVTVAGTTLGNMLPNGNGVNPALPYAGGAFAAGQQTAPKLGFMAALSTLTTAFLLGADWQDKARQDADQKILEYLKSGGQLYDGRVDPRIVGQFGSQLYLPNRDDVQRVADTNGITLKTDTVVIENAKAVQAYNDQRLGEHSRDPYVTPPPPTADRSTDAIERIRNHSLKFQSVLGTATGAVAQFAMAASGAAGTLASIAGQALGAGAGYFMPPSFSGSGYGTFVRSSALDARYRSMYPDQVAYTEQRINKYLTDATSTSNAIKKLGDAASNAAQKIGDALKGFVSDLIKPSAVTDADLQAAADGTYVNKPDELRRQLLAVGSGTDPSIYGDTFAKQYAFLQSKFQGADANALAGMWETGELFANMTPDEIGGLWNQDALKQGLMSKIFGSIGQSNLIKSITEQLLGSLSPDVLAQFAESQGLGADADFSSIASKFMGKEFGIGEDAGIGGLIDEKTTEKFDDFKKILERINQLSKIVIEVTWDSEKFEKAKESILEAEKFILDHIANYANLFIKITASFSQASADTAPVSDGGGLSGAKAIGGYVDKGKYLLGEQGYEYVLPHDLVKWLESVLGHRIKSPDEIAWLFKAANKGGMPEVMKQMSILAGSSVPMPKDMQDWLKQVLIKGPSEIAQEQEEAAKAALGGSGGGGAGGIGNLNDLINSLNSVVDAIERLIQKLDVVYQIPMGNVTGNYGYGTGMTNIQFFGNIIAPNNSTWESLTKDLQGQAKYRALVNHGV